MPAHAVKPTHEAWCQVISVVLLMAMDPEESCPTSTTLRLRAILLDSPWMYAWCRLLARHTPPGTLRGYEVHGEWVTRLGVADPRARFEACGSRRHAASLLRYNARQAYVRSTRTSKRSQRPKTCSIEGYGTTARGDRVTS